MTVRSSDRSILIGALLVAVFAFTAAAAIYTADWQTCLKHFGGMTCREPRNMSAGAFTGLAGTAITLVANARK